MMPVSFFIMLVIVIPLIILAIVLSSRSRDLSSIKRRVVGDGQHGSARFMTPDEIRKTYPTIPFTPELWRRGENRPEPSAVGTVIGFEKHGKKIFARLDCSDSHTMVISTTGGGKTTFFLYPNIELCLACGCSFVCTDSKGDNFRDYAGIAESFYGYKSRIIDLRNPAQYDHYNLLHLVNKYMDAYKKSGDPADMARAERYAKITAKAIVQTKGFDGGGQNAFFYDSAEGLISAVALIVAEFCEPAERHIVTVFKLVLELLEHSGSKDPDETWFHVLMKQLPSTHKARWLAGAALISPDKSMASIMSTAISRMLAFIDSEIEQLICFDSSIDTEQLCSEKVAVFIVFPEADKSKQFLVPLIVKQLYDECIEYANHYGNKLERRMYYFLDEYGTMPAFPDAEAMYSAGRSRGILQLPMIQSLSQLEANYGKNGAETIKECCQNTIFGGLSPLSNTAVELSKALDTQTILSGSVSTSGRPGGRSRSQQMISRPLMTPDEIRTMPMGEWIFLKTHEHPMRTQLRRFNFWGITLDRPYEAPAGKLKPIQYADRETLIRKIRKVFHKAPEPFVPSTPESVPAAQQSRQIKTY